MKIDKKCSYILKGIAIILMFYHHFCGFPEWLLEGSQCKSMIPITVSGMSVMRIIAVFGTICVGIFTFCSGYYWGEDKDSAGGISVRLKKCFSLLLNYWVIWVIYIFIGIGFGEPFPSTKIFFANLFGMGLIPNTDYICVTFGWYIGFYMIAILLLPPIHKMCDKYKCDILIVAGWLLLFILSKQIALWTVFSDFISWGPIFSIGCFVAKYDLLEKLGSRIQSHKRVWLSSVILVLVFGVKCLLGSSYKGFNLYILYTPLFVTALFYIVDAGIKAERRSVKTVMGILEYLGRYSMNLWLLHGIFFTPKRGLQFIAYCPQYGLLITVWAIVLLLPLSVVVEKAQKGIQNFINLLKS